MNKVFKRALVLALSVSMAVSMLGGCASQKASKKAGPSSSTGSETLSNISGQLEIQYFVGGYGDIWWKTVIHDFQAKYPNVSVVQDAGSSVNTTMKPRWISNNPPDVVYIDGTGSSESQMVEDGQLMDITAFAKTLKYSDGTPLLNDFITTPSKYSDGKTYTLPLVFDMRGMWYDKTWFQQNGYKVPTDFNSWVDSMKDIKSKGGISPLSLSGIFPTVALEGLFYQGIAAAGGQPLLTSAIKGEKGAWSSDKVLSVAQKLQQLAQNGLLDSGFAALGTTQVEMNFLQHKFAFIPVGLWMPNDVKGNVPTGFNYTFMPVPINDSGKKMVVVPQVRTVAIAKNAKNAEAAKAFVQFIYQKQYAQKFAELTGAMMNIKDQDLNSDSTVPSYLKETNTLINNESKVEIDTIPYQMSGDLETPIANALTSMLLGKIDAKTFCQTAENAATTYRSNLSNK